MSSKNTGKHDASTYPWQHHVKMIKAGLLVTILIGLFPTATWIIATALEGSSGIDELAGNPSAVFRTLAKATAFSALALFAWTAILGLRIRPIMKLFGGFISKYRVHAKLGRITILLAALHPILLGISLALNSQSSWLDIFNFTDLTTILGYVGLIVTFCLLYFATSKRISHLKWVKIHTFFAWIVPLHFAHALVAQSELTANPVLLAFFTLLVTAQVLSYIIYLFFSKLIIEKHTYTLKEVNHINDSITELVLSPEKEIMHHHPGQFAYFSIRGSKVVDSEPHPFTISTADNGKYLRVAIKGLGDWSKAVRDAECGLEVIVEGPYGEFCQNTEAGRTQVWLAGGVGITPFLSMARSILPDQKTPIKLFYATKDICDAAFFNEILEIAKLRPDILTARLVTEKYSGFLNMEDIKKDVGNDLSAATYYICGPPGMMHAMTKSLQNEGVAKEDIITEEFSY